MVDEDRARTTTKALRRYLRKFPILVALKRRAFSIVSKLFPGYFNLDRGSTSLNILRSFPLYVPNSSGSYKDRAFLTIQTINQTIPALRSLAASTGARKLDVIPIQLFPKSEEDLASVSEFKTFLDKYQSDKANPHNYHYLYGTILQRRIEINGVFEIGLGTNNTDVVSTMGVLGKPGASLRAFREFLSNAKIYGADVDRRILFQENRISTFFVDQTKSSTFDDLESVIPSDLDLVIDDGLHSPDANLLALRFALSKVRIGGWVVIEDIGAEALPVWEVVSSILSESAYERYLLTAVGGFLFAIKRIA